MREIDVNVRSSRGFCHGGCCGCFGNRFSRGNISCNIDFEVVTFFFAGCVPLSVVSDAGLDVYGLVAVAVEDHAFNVSGDDSLVDLLVEIVDFNLFHCVTGP